MDESNVVLIKNIKEENINSLYDALKLSAIENGIGDRYCHTAEILHQYIFQNNLASCFIAWLGTQPIGFLLYSTCHRNFTLHQKPGIYIHGLYVDKTHRRKGVGTALLNHLIKTMGDEKGKIEFALLKTNQGGEAFLNKLSFKEINFIKPMRLQIA